MSSTALVAAGSRLAVGSSRNSTSRIARQRAGERQALLLAAREPPRRPVAQRREPDLIEQRRAIGARCGATRCREREGDVRRGRAAQHHRLWNTMARRAVAVPRRPN